MCQIDYNNIDILMQHFIVTENAYLPSLESVHPFLDSVAANSSQGVPSNADSTGDSGSVIQT